MRRRVLYIPGYDPIPPRRYRELFRREGAAQAAISGYQLSTAQRADDTGFGWAADSQIDGQASHVEFEVLIWADLVQGSMGQSIASTYGQLIRTAWAYIGSGALWRLMKLRRAPVIAALYPIVMLLVQLALAEMVAALAGWALATWIGGAAGGVAGLMLAGGVTYAGLVLWRRLDGRLFAYYLMHDYAFTAQNGGAYPPALETRLSAFGDRIAEVTRGEWDEVLIVGHSSGAYLAVSVLADLIRAGRLGPVPLGLLSLGHVVPMASFLPQAGRLRRDLHDLGASDTLCWVDVTAPGDACCFGLCDPVRVSNCAPPEQHGPLVLSAAFTQTLSEQQQRDLRGRWFRLHFQYLCAFERPGGYDYFAITAGPQLLAERFANRAPSPGRITRAVNKWGPDK